MAINNNEIDDVINNIIGSDDYLEQDSSAEKKAIISQITREIKEINSRKQGVDLSVVYHNLHNLLDQYSSQITPEEFQQLLLEINPQLEQISDKRLREKDEVITYESGLSPFEFGSLQSEENSENKYAAQALAALALLANMMIDEALSDDEKKSIFENISNEFKDSAGIGIEEWAEKSKSFANNENMSLFKDVVDKAFKGNLFSKKDEEKDGADKENSHHFADIVNKVRAATRNSSGRE